MPRQFFVGGNFKMNGTIKTVTEIVDNLNKAPLDPDTEVVIAPPGLFLLLVRSQLDPKIKVCSQNVFDKANGAFTGETSAQQLADSNIDWALCGHSERRAILGETDAFVASKTKAALGAGLAVILCCGETLEQRLQNKTLDVVTAQLKAVADLIKEEDLWSRRIVVAYEPVWAIGTGKVATTDQAQEVHAAIRKWLGEEVGEAAREGTRIIYGGSVTEKNCGELAQQKDVDGFLVGGASLKPACRRADGNNIVVDIINARKHKT
ncbi:MAG: hypothetical protein Q9217_004419 [Psora testacea]